MPSCSLGPKWILTASPRSPSELGQINPSPKYYRSEAEAYYTPGKCHPFPLRGSALVNTDGPPLATEVLCNTWTQVPGPGRGPQSGSQGRGKRTHEAVLPPPRRGSATGRLQGETGEGVFWVGFFFCCFFAACLELGDKSREAGVRWALEMDSRREAGREGRRRKRWEGLPRKSREAGIRRAENGCVRSSWAW